MSDHNIVSFSHLLDIINYQSYLNSSGSLRLMLFMACPLAILFLILQSWVIVGITALLKIYQEMIKSIAFARLISFSPPFILICFIRSIM